ncbi:MAG: translation initiation factor 1 [Motiliproteus sp.]|jgi:translation initiation factor 1
MSKRTNALGGLVYSTDQGRMCPDCSLAIEQCSCALDSVPAGDGIVRVSRETKGRKGKGVTLISGVPLASAELKQLAKLLKQRSSTGGAVKDGVIEIQGDQRALMVELLQAQGYTVKRSGG